MVTVHRTPYSNGYHHYRNFEISSQSFGYLGVDPTLVCGATNKETTLEIDHIIPVAKGGTNDISNLQTLCKECNRAKSATIWKTEPNIQILEDQYNHLNKYRHQLQQ